MSVLMCFILIVFSGGDSKQTVPTQGDTSVVQPTITDVLAAHSVEWMKIPGVRGTGEGQKDGKRCVLIFVEKRTTALVRKLPKIVDGYPVVVKEVGKVKALEK